MKRLTSYLIMLGLIPAMIHCGSAPMEIADPTPAQTNPANSEVLTSLPCSNDQWIEGEAFCGEQKTTVACVFDGENVSAVCEDSNGEYTFVDQYGEKIPSPDQVVYEKKGTNKAKICAWFWTSK